MRWRVEGSDGQAALFDHVERVAGRGEFRGMEFFHVRAGRLINTLPRSSRLPFRHTVNAYRGCSHACSYCTVGDTAVLLADGGTRRMADLRVGDEIVGTDGGQGVPTTVVDHFSTGRQSVVRTTLADGTELLTSPRHHLLSSEGWCHAVDLQPGMALRACAGAARQLTHTDVVAVEPLGIELPMYDITTGTGDYVSDGVVSHNCFARPTHDYLGLDIDEGFDRTIVVKTNAVERLRAELAPSRWAGEPIAMGTNTDPYQRCEGKYHLTQGLVEVLSEARNPFSILTKSTLVLRDADLLAEAAERTQVSLTFSVGTLDEEVWRATETGTPPPWKRIEAIARLREKGVEAGVLVAPILPGLSDGAGQIEAVVRAATEAGATSVGGGMPVFLKPGVREVFLRRLAASHPHLVEPYERAYARGRVYPTAKVKDDVRRKLDDALARHRPASPVRVRRWRPVPQPQPPPAPDPGEQLSLGV